MNPLPDQPEAVIRLEITSEPVHLAEVRRVVEAAAREAGVVDTEVNGVALAIDEALSNIIRHGYRGEAGHPIEVQVERCGVHGRPALRLLLKDRGRQVEPDQIVGRDLSEVRPGGLGTHIIRSVMDQVQYSKRDGGGMRLEMVKFVNGTPATRSDPAPQEGSLG